MLKDLETSAEDVYEMAHDQVDNTENKTKAFKDSTIEKTKMTLSDIAEALEQISNKIKRL